MKWVQRNICLLEIVFRKRKADSDCSRVVLAVDKGGVEGRQRLLRWEGTKFYHLG